MDELLKVIACDDYFVAIEKPAGMLTVPGRGPENADCLLVRVQVDIPNALVVHRLDMATSGIVLFARGLSSQREFSRMFRERLIHKQYIAIVQGEPAHNAGLIDLPIAKDWPNRPRHVIDLEQGKPSQTNYRVLSRHGSHARLELIPITGRSHQLRVHLKHLGHPIVGDPLYGTEPSPETSGETSPQHNRMLLHASRLQFVHPFTAKSIELVSPPAF